MSDLIKHCTHVAFFFKPKKVHVDLSYINALSSTKNYDPFSSLNILSSDVLFRFDASGPDPTAVNAFRCISYAVNNSSPEISCVKVTLLSVITTVSILHPFSSVSCNYKLIRMTTLLKYSTSISPCIRLILNAQNINNTSLVNCFFCPLKIFH